MNEAERHGAGVGERPQLRPARREDVPALMRFIEELADYERLSHEVVADEALLERALFGERPAAEAVIARWGGSDAGFVLFFPTFSTFLARPGLYVEDLFVSPAMRGKGIGKALLRHVAQLAVTRGCGRLEWSVLDWNRPAIEFYERAGARPLSDWTMYRLTEGALAEFAARGGGNG
jgi:GNAT superfamily N-acetyltransferase